MINTIEFIINYFITFPLVVAMAGLIWIVIIGAAADLLATIIRNFRAWLRSKKNE